MDAGVAEPGGRRRGVSHDRPLYFLKHADVHAPPRLPAPPSPRRDRLVPVRCRRDGRGRRDPVADRPGDRRDRRPRRAAGWSASRSSSPSPGSRGWASASAGGLSPGASRSPSSTTCATRLYSHLQSLELGFFDRQQTGQLMSRVTVDLQAVRFFLGYGLIFIGQSFFTLVLAAVAMFVIAAAARAARARARPVRRDRRVPLRPPLAPRDAGGPAADRRADRGRGGERLRRARREGVRARAVAAGALPPPDRPRVRPGDVHDAPAGALRAADRLPALPRASRRSCSSAGARRSTARSTSPSSPPSTATC